MRVSRQVSFLAALCLFLSAVEYAIPKPLPVMRLGLANLPLMAGLYLLRPGDLFLLMGLKVLGQAFISGTLFSYVFLFSAAGTFAATAAMFTVHRLFGRHVTLIGISSAGALANNAAQLVLGRYLLFGDGIRYIAPALLISGTVTGVALGVFAQQFLATSRWFTAMTTEASPTPGPLSKSSLDLRPSSFASQNIATDTAPGGTAAASGPGTRHRTRAAATLGAVLPLLVIPAFLLVRRLPLLWGIVGTAALAVRLRRGRVRLLPSLAVTGGVTFFALLSPAGKVLLRLGAFTVTQGALEAGLRRGGILVGMVFLSQLALAALKPRSRSGFFADMLTHYGRLTTAKPQWQRGHILSALDEHLWGCYFGHPSGN